MPEIENFRLNNVARVEKTYNTNIQTYMMTKIFWGVIDRLKTVNFIA